MSDDLKGIFDKIWRSEILSKDKNQRVENLKKQVDDLVNGAKAIEEELNSLEVQKLVKIQKCSDEELKYKWNSNALEILKKQEDSLKNEEFQLDIKLQDAEIEVTQLKEQFSSTVTKFSDAYFALGDACSRNELNMQQKLEAINEEKIFLQGQLEVAEEIEKLKRIVTELENDIKHQQCVVEDLKGQLRDEQLQLLRLQSKKKSTENFTSKDPTFEQLQLSLHKCLEKLSNP